MSSSINNSKIVLITGGIGDLATAITKQLAPQYGHIVALDIASAEQAHQWQAELREQGFNNTSYRQMDVCNFDQCREVISALFEAFGRIDVLINNAGITRDAVFHKMTKQQWDDVLRVNLDGMFNVTRQVVDYMRAQNSGRIVNISSVNGQKGEYSQANYAASKAGVYGFSKSLARELISRNITVNSLSPGYVDTRLLQAIRPDILAAIITQIPAQRLGKPEEIACAVEFLISENSGYITGSNLSINGGLHMD